MTTVPVPRLPGGLPLLIVTLMTPLLTTNARGEPNAFPPNGVQQFVIAQGTPQETGYFVQEQTLKGPSVMIVGGVHGDEPAGVEAAKQIAHWPITRGKLVVIPEANVTALAKSRRFIPGEKSSRRDLNRNFPKQDQHSTTARGELASAHWVLAQEIEPDWLIDLHEGFDFHQLNDRSVGSTIIVFPNSRSITAATRMLEAVNETIEEPEKKFIPLVRGPVDGSFARAAAEHLGANSMIAETTAKDQPLDLRVQQHQIMVESILRYLKMVSGESVASLSATHPTRH